MLPLGETGQNIQGTCLYDFLTTACDSAGASVQISALKIRHKRTLSARASPASFIHGMGFGARQGPAPQTLPRGTGGDHTVISLLTLDFPAFARRDREVCGN